MTQNEKIAHLRTFYPSLPDNLTIRGSLDLEGAAIAALPDNLTIGGALYLRGTAITALPDNLTIGGSLYLRGTAITAIPDNLTIGGALDLEGTAITGSVHDCGERKRTICAYNHPTKGRVVSLGRFVGTEDECVEEINYKYSGEAAADYIAKVKQAFAYKAIAQ